jgi:16S rRNA processing protein RimM
MDDPASGEPRRFTVQSVNEHRGYLKIILEGITTVEDADTFKGALIYVPESEVPPLPEGEFYHYQLFGLEVFTASGRSLGTVQEILTAGEKDVYVVRGHGEEYLIPVTEEHVRDISTGKGRIDLYPMKGYLPE